MVATLTGCEPSPPLPAVPPPLARLWGAIESLFAQTDFWAAGGRRMGRQATALERLRTARSPAAAAAALLAAEALLFAAGGLTEEYVAYWRAAWRRQAQAGASAAGSASGAGGAANLLDALLLAASLRRQAAPAPRGLGRGRFLRLAAAARCPLFFPQPGEAVVLLRSGVRRLLTLYLARMEAAPGTAHG